LDKYIEDDYLGSMNGDFVVTNTKFEFNEDGTVKIKVPGIYDNMIEKETLMESEGEYGGTYYGTWENTGTTEKIDSELYPEERVVYQIYQDDMPMFKVLFAENPGETYFSEIVADLGDDTYMLLGRDSE